MIMLVVFFAMAALDAPDVLRLGRWLIGKLRGEGRTDG